MIPTYTINLDAVQTVEDLYNQLGKQLGFPEYFGNNADALYDSITGYISLPVKLEFTHVGSEEKTKFGTIIQTLEDAAKELGDDFKFSVVEDGVLDFAGYMKLTEDVVDKKIVTAPYDEEGFYNYTKLNLARMNRWNKSEVLTQDTINAIKAISKAQNWILITEPWCGDAAHIVPIIAKMAQLNRLINFKIQLRDSGSEIDKYLTNGRSKSIPILVIRDGYGEDLAVWGPRPEGASELYTSLVAANTEFEDIKVELQNWYNKNKAIDIQQEISGIVSKISHGF